MKHYDVLIVGGGAAGMTAAWTLWRSKRTLKILLAEREAQLGGVLRRCIHRGFGLGYFKEDMTGIEYAGYLENRLSHTEIEIRRGTEAFSLADDRTVWLAGAGGGEQVSFRKMILAAGCMERSVGSLAVAGVRPSGVYGAGEMQEMINIHHYRPGKCAVVLGCGDIGLIVARRLTLSGIKVRLIVERQKKSPAMERNIRECLIKYRLPLRLQSTIACLHGMPRLSGVTVKNLLTGELERVACDTLAVAAGLIPDRTLTETFREDKPDWLYYCGNCDHVHAVVDSISFQAEKTALKIAEEII